MATSTATCLLSNRQHTPKYLQHGAAAVLLARHQSIFSFIAFASRKRGKSSAKQFDISPGDLSQFCTHPKVLQLQLPSSNKLEWLNAPPYYGSTKGGEKIKCQEMGQSEDSQGGQEGRKGSSSGRRCLFRVYAGLISSLMSEGVHRVMFLLVEDFLCLFFVDLLSISFAFTRLAPQRGPPSATQTLL